MLATIGRLLYGSQWVSALARDLAMSRRNMQYLADGSQPVHAGIVGDMVKLVDERRAALEEAGKALRRSSRLVFRGLTASGTSPTQSR